MKRVQRNWAGLAAGMVLAGTVVTQSGCGRAVAQERAPSDSPLELSVYKQDFALVRQRRGIEVKEGNNVVRISDVSHQLDPNSIVFERTPGIEVTGNTFDMGIGASGNAVQRLAGRTVEVILPSNDGHLGDRLTGTLEPTADGGFLLRTSDRVYVNPPGTISAKDDGGAPTSPGLSVQVDGKQAGTATLDLAYLTRGLSWSADYIARLDTERSVMDIEAWATVTNNTGVAYPDAKLTFVAGSPNRAVEGDTTVVSRFEAAKAEYRRSPQSAVVDGLMSAPVEAGEGYEFPVKARSTIGIDQRNRIRMFDPKSVPVRLDYSVALSPISPWMSMDGRVNAQLAVAFTNSEAKGIGMPLPAGGIRIYEGSGSTRYTGAATLEDLPVGATTNLTLSKSFDVFAEPKVVSTRRIDKKTVERTLRIHLQNAKSHPVKLRVVAPIQVDGFKFVSGSKPERPNASILQWRESVPAKGSRDLTVMVRMRG